YDFLNDLNGLFVDSRNRRAMDAIYGRFTGQSTRFGEIANASKKMIMLVSLASEVNALSNQLQRVAESHRRYRDFTLNSLTFAIREVIACLSVYRTYVRALREHVAERDALCIQHAVAEAKRRNPRTSPL